MRRAALLCIFLSGLLKSTLNAVEYDCITIMVGNLCPLPYGKIGLEIVVICRREIHFGAIAVSEAVAHTKSGICEFALVILFDKALKVLLVNAPIQMVRCLAVFDNAITVSKHVRELICALEVSECMADAEVFESLFVFGDAFVAAAIIENVAKGIGS